jgi:hypothetical protein
MTRIKTSRFKPSARLYVFALIAGLCLLLTHIDDAAAQACATVIPYDYADPWVWSPDLFVLRPGLYFGTVSGQATVATDETFAGETCPANTNYQMQGSYQNGQFNIAFSPINSNACVAFSVQGTVSAPGCNNASGTWTSTNGGSGTFNWTHACATPTGEAPSVFSQWDNNPDDVAYQTAATFSTALAPTSYDWGGRTITEEFLSDPIDSCYLPGGPYPMLSRPPSRSLTISSNEGYTDNVGPTQVAVNGYRKAGRTPCGFVNYQTLVIDCPNPPGNAQYALNALDAFIGNTAEGGTRAGVAASHLWGTAAPIILSDPVLQLLLLH